MNRGLREPIWRNVRLPSSLRPPLALRRWLSDHTSLTARLQARCAAGFQVEVISERLERPRPGEAALLGIARGRLAWVRQVYLRCGDRRWVYARTVIPIATLAGPNAGLTRLGTRPLGGLLFSLPQVRRGRLQATQSAVPGAAQPIYGRRSLFHLHGRALLVSEFFLDEFVRGLTP